MYPILARYFRKKRPHDIYLHQVSPLCVMGSGFNFPFLMKLLPCKEFCVLESTPDKPNTKIRYGWKIVKNTFGSTPIDYRYTLGSFQFVDINSHKGRKTAQENSLRKQMLKNPMGQSFCHFKSVDNNYNFFTDDNEYFFKVVAKYEALLNDFIYTAFLKKLSAILKKNVTVNREHFHKALQTGFFILFEKPYKKKNQITAYYANLQEQNNMGRIDDWFNNLESFQTEPFTFTFTGNESGKASLYEKET